LLQNPFPSDALGQPAAVPANAKAPFETYDVMVVRPDRNVFPDERGQMRVRRALVVVRAPRTPHAEIERCEYLDKWEYLRVGTTQETLNGIEPTLTFDGRLLVWMGHPNNDAGQSYLMYSWNQVPFALTGWSKPKNLVQMFYDDRDADVAGLPFHERYPLAKNPLRSASGKLYEPGQWIHGNYPWITLDGTDVVHTAAHSPALGARRTALSVIGAMTGWGTRIIDGPLNLDRHGDTRTFVASPGVTPGFWRPYADLASRPLPYTPSEAPVVSLIQGRKYAELDSSDALDGDYALVLHMNESVSHTSGQYQVALTPDTSGWFNTGGLLHGAAFPQEFAAVDETVGRVGQGIYFPDGGEVRVLDSDSLRSPREALTVQLAVKRLQAVDRALVAKPGSWRVELVRGQLAAAVTVNGVEHAIGPLGPTLRLDAWTDVAVRFDGAAGRLTAFVDGHEVGEVTLPRGDLTLSRADLRIGPVTPSNPPASGAVYLLDELRVSSVARTDAEVARAAYVPTSPSGWQKVERLPLGLDAAEARLPHGAATSKEAAALGKQLFFEPRLSGDGSLSCATCHDPDKGFGDGLGLGRGIGGQVLGRHSPSVINRLFSTQQFWDGRAEDLEEQVLGPIENPQEMGSTVAKAVSFLNRHPDYDRSFRAAFGSSADADSLAKALAAYLRSLNSGDSDADRFEAGELNALSASAQRGRLLFQGKARCTACHDGANYTDEAFHDTASTQSGDLGRFFATGRDRDKNRFKTPTLRDVALSAPYLHDGSARTLRQVIDLYDQGGLRSEGRDPEMRPLELTPQEKDDLVAFLEALTGRTVDRVPPRLPR
jgi:cytochrome c peroxidase